MNIQNNHSNAPTDFQVFFSTDREVLIRESIALNSDTPLYMLLELSKDESPLVREAVALNVTTPLPELEILSRDPDINVRTTAIRSLNNRSKANDEN